VASKNAAWCSIQERERNVLTVASNKKMWRENTHICWYVNLTWAHQLLMISSSLKDKELNIAAITVASNLTTNVKTPQNPNYSTYDAIREWLLCWNNWNFRIHFGYKSKEYECDRGIIKLFSWWLANVLWTSRWDSKLNNSGNENAAGDTATTTVT